MKEMQKADREGLFPDLLVERQRRMTEVLGRECSTFKGDLLGQTIYITSDPKNIQALLATQFPDYDLGPARRGNMGQTLGDGIFVQDGRAWEHSRALLRPNFARDQVSDLELEERHVQNLMKMLPSRTDGWTNETDIQTLFFRLTIDSATEFLFGESVDSQINEAAGSEAGKDGHEKNEILFSRHFDSAQKHMAQRFRLGDLWWLYNPKSYKEDNKIVKDFVDHYVRIALQRSDSHEKKAEEGHGKKKYVFLEALAEQTKDPVELNAQMLNILLAGRDTTASLLSWLFNQLLRNPGVFEKLRAAVIESFGPYSDDTQDITFATLKECQYLQYCLNETLRLWTVVPGNGRRSNKATTLPRGGGPDGNSPIYIKPQTDVNYSIHVMHRRKDLWGEDAEEFKPERFAGRKPGWEYVTVPRERLSTIESMLTAIASFLPFNGGPRICIGQQFALTEASYVVVRLLQRFDKIVPGAHEMEGPITTNLGLTSCPGKPVTLKLHEAQA